MVSLQKWFGLQLREKLSVDEIGYENILLQPRLTIYMIRLSIILKDIEYFWMGIFKIKHSMVLMVPI